MFHPLKKDMKKLQYRPNHTSLLVALSLACPGAWLTGCPTTAVVGATAGATACGAAADTKAVNCIPGWSPSGTTTATCCPDGVATWISCPGSTPSGTVTEIITLAAAVPTTTLLLSCTSPDATVILMPS